MNIDMIKDGYVIDHIKAGNAMKIYNLLNLDELECQVALITNAKSKKTGKKDIIKIGKLIDLDLDKLSAIDASLTVNVVKNNKLIEKKKLELPKEIINIYKCKNPRCITSIEHDLDQIFLLTNQEEYVYRCKYCEEKYHRKN